MNTETTIKAQLIAASRKLFLKFGYSKVTMDELAREMGMSKKTIYLYFPSKLKLMEEVLMQMREEIQTGVNQLYHDTQLSTQEKLQKIMVFTAEKLSVISPFVAADLERNVPELWDKMRKIKYELAYRNIRNLLENSVKEGTVRKDIQPELMVMLYSCAVQYMRDTTFLVDFPKDIQEKIPSTSEKIYEEVVNVLFEGMFV